VQGLKSHCLAQPIGGPHDGSLGFLKRAPRGLFIQIEVAGEFEYDSIDLLEHTLAIFEIGSQQILWALNAIRVASVMAGR
jgi:hypothetical protein